MRNYHLFAAIDGQLKKFMLRKGTPDYELIAQIGLHQISSGQLRELLEKRLETQK